MLTLAKTLLALQSVKNCSIKFGEDGTKSVTYWIVELTSHQRMDLFPWLTVLYNDTKGLDLDKRADKFLAYYLGSYPLRLAITLQTLHLRTY